ncbi:hypothetical protein CROQUDRAFT_660807, partial [Cronartium quercuum f. sp. fusiforme G11]
TTSVQPPSLTCTNNLCRIPLISSSLTLFMPAHTNFTYLTLPSPANTVVPHQQYPVITPPLSAVSPWKHYLPIGLLDGKQDLTFSGFNGMRIGKLFYHSSSPKLLFLTVPGECFLDVVMNSCKCFFFFDQGFVIVALRMFYEGEEKDL